MKRIAYLIAVNAIVLIVILAFVFVAVEAGARVYLSRMDDASFVRYASLNQYLARRDAQDVQVQWTPHRHMGYIPTPNYRNGQNMHNEHGYRGESFPIEKPEGEFRIVCVGGSTTYTSNVSDYRKSYPAILEENLREAGYNVRVINSGVVSWTSLSTLINFETRVLDLDPDLVIVYHAINDIAVRTVWPPEAHRGDYSGVKGPLVTQRFMPPIWQYSTFLRMMAVSQGFIAPHVEVEQQFGANEPTLHWNELMRQHAAGTYPEGIFEEVDVQEMWDANTTDIFERNMTNIGSIARQHGVACIFATFAYCPGFDAFVWSHAPTMEKRYAEANAATVRAAGASGALLFDYAAAFPQEKKYYHDGVHVNEEGAAMKAAAFSKFIVERNIIPANFRGAE